MLSIYNNTLVFKFSIFRGGIILEKEIISLWEKKREFLFEKKNVVLFNNQNIEVYQSLISSVLQPIYQPTFELEVYIGSDINRQPDPTKYPTNPNTAKTRRAEPDPTVNYLTRTRPDTKWVTKFPGPQPEFYPKNASIL